MQHRKKSIETTNNKNKNKTKQKQQKEPPPQKKQMRPIENKSKMVELNPTISSSENEWYTCRNYLLLRN